MSSASHPSSLSQHLRLMEGSAKSAEMYYHSEAIQICEQVHLFAKCGTSLSQRNVVHILISLSITLCRNGGMASRFF